MHGIQTQVRAALDAARSRKDDSAVTRLEYEELKAVAAAVKALAQLNHEDFLPHNNLSDFSNSNRKKPFW